ncbi:MAG: ABC transporter permease [Campylobacterales bacterium]|jgi:ABC-type transport system involved in multi-copper enzyme maturation permease subunit
MKPSVIRAYVKKEFLDILRSRIILLVYIMPSLITLLFGYGIRMEVTHARTVLLDHDGSKLSRTLRSSFTHSKYFDLLPAPKSESEALASLRRGETDIVVILPESMERTLLKGRPVTLGLYLDGAFPSRASTMESYVERVLLQNAATVGAVAPQITLNARYQFNRAMRDEEMILPGIIALALLIAPAILSALLIAKEKETGTIFNFYASPLRKSEFIIAKLTPVFLLHSVNVVVLFLWAVYLFDVPFRGSFVLYLLTGMLYIFISISIGLLVSIVASTQIVAIVATMVVTIIPAFLYSGMLMPISSMTGISYVEAHVYPTMYYTHLLYDYFLVGDGLGAPKNRLYLLILAGYASVLFTVGALLLKKRLA